MSEAVDYTSLDHLIGWGLFIVIVMGMVALSTIVIPGFYMLYHKVKRKFRKRQ